ncbi:hypothetical protein SLS62_002942 [Diatrype stigma]|uniref:Uncharacterized protein n=1 Tax=Diatrype stigma TaxID=117547 RepID=A0AAN9UXI9_9PEZI
MRQEKMFSPRNREIAPWISQATSRRLGRYVPGGGSALEGEYTRTSKSQKATKKDRRRGVVVSDELTPAIASYPERKDEWGSFLNVLHLVTESCGNRLTHEEEVVLAQRVHSQLKLEGGLDSIREHGRVPGKELQHLYSAIDLALAQFAKAKLEIICGACEDMQLEADRCMENCLALVGEVNELRRAASQGSQSDNKRLEDAQRELEEAEKHKRQAQAEAEKMRNDFKAMCTKLKNEED